jgi:hypothetical protein
MDTARVLEILREAGVDVSLQGDQVTVTPPAGVSVHYLSALIQERSAEVREILRQETAWLERLDQELTAE